MPNFFVKVASEINHPQKKIGGHELCPKPIFGKGVGMILEKNMNGTLCHCEIVTDMAQEPTAMNLITQISKERSTSVEPKTIGHPLFVLNFGFLGCFWLSWLVASPPVFIVFWTLSPGEWGTIREKTTKLHRSKTFFKVGRRFHVNESTNMSTLTHVYSVNFMVPSFMMSKKTKVLHRDTRMIPLLLHLILKELLHCPTRFFPIFSRTRTLQTRRFSGDLKLTTLDLHMESEEMNMHVF